MAQRVNVVLVDDIDGSEAEETVSFAIDGAEYEIDLSAANAAKLRNALAAYVENGRRTGGRRRRAAAPRTPAKASKSSSSANASAAEIREWARANGWEVPDRGRVAAEVREAFEAAHS